MNAPIAITNTRAFRSPDGQSKITMQIETAEGSRPYSLTLERAHALVDALKEAVSGVHPMYRLPENASVLCQGDLISSKRLVATGALKGHQDYFAKRVDFPLFCVMTQTCDLQRPRCKEYITLAVVRLLRNVFDKHSVKNWEARDKTGKKLAPIIEHENNSRDYFYLHPEPRYEIHEHSVIDLRVMFSLSSKLHYDQIVSSRTLSMNELYAANLGWMAGNVFARVALPPWEKIHPEGETKKARIEKLIKLIQDKGPENLADLEVPIFDSYEP